MSSIGMRFKTKCLYLDGIELCREQLPDEPHYDGDLIIEDWGSGENLFKHNIRKARFLDPKSAHGLEILLPLFDPVIVKMTSDQMLLRGARLLQRCAEPRQPCTRMRRRQDRPGRE